MSETTAALISKLLNPSVIRYGQAWIPAHFIAHHPELSEDGLLFLNCRYPLRFELRDDLSKPIFLSHPLNH